MKVTQEMVERSARALGTIDPKDWWDGYVSKEDIAMAVLEAAFEDDKISVGRPSVSRSRTQCEPSFRLEMSHRQLMLVHASGVRKERPDGR